MQVSRKQNFFLNKQNKYMSESLPECEQEMRNEAHKRDIITSFNNSVVSVLVRDGNKKTKFVKVKEVEEVDNLDAVKKDKHSFVLFCQASWKFFFHFPANSLQQLMSWLPIRS